jgi:hypothetical protein
MDLSTRVLTDNPQHLHSTVKFGHFALRVFSNMSAASILAGKRP